MIKAITAQTAEADDVETAVSEILEQLENGQRMKHSVGIVSCFADFIGSGVLSALAEKLPFPLAGITTIASSANSGGGEVLLTLTVLTSDDVEFSAAVSEPVSSEDGAPLRSAWEKSSAGRESKPSLMFTFAPLLMGISGDFYVETLTEITGNVPNFGTLAVDHNSDYHEARVIFNGEAFSNRLAIILCYGKIEPKFFIGGISEEKVFHDKAIVTSSQGNLLKGVNGVSVMEYLVSLGLETDENGVVKGINSFPFIQDYNDGTQPVVRVMFGISPDGSAVCGGKIPAGATLSVGFINAEEVLAGTEAALRKVRETQPSSALIFSCIGRFFAQGFNSGAEMDKVKEILGCIPYHLSYSGTELCPVYGKDGKLTNRSHNDTIAICIL